MDSDQPARSAEEPIGNATLVVRADANKRIGNGHVMRCLALAQAWQDRSGAVAFVSNLPDTLRTRLEAERISVHALAAVAGSREDADQVVDLARAIDARHIVVDGYHFGADYQKWIKEAGLRLLFLDDNGHADHYYADLVLNQNIHADASLYPRREPYTHLLLGTRYALLRREFWQWRDWRREIPDVARKVLVTMGGSDPENVTLKVLHALEHVQLDDLQVKVVVGGSNRRYKQLWSVARQSPHRIRLERNVTDMPTLMAWADVAISAGGSTCWELAFMGLPSLGIVLADNQYALMERMSEQNMIVALGWHGDLRPAQIAESITSLLVNAAFRASMSMRQRELVDSHGVERVVKALQQTRLLLRPVTPSDCRLVFNWANESSTRKASFDPTPILWEAHVAWFEQALRDEHLLFWIAEDHTGKPIGQVRFAVDNREATISVSVDRACRGKGYGAALIEQASWRAIDTRGIDVIHAYIKRDNIASVKAFARAGYSPAPPVEISGHMAIHMILEENECSIEYRTSSHRSR